MAGVLKVEVDCRVSGPLADGEAIRAERDWVEASVKAIAGEGLDMLRAFPMDKTGRAHGVIQSLMHVTQDSPTVARIKGPQVESVAWAPWLEGVSKRNISTAFKGYHLFRKTAADLNDKAGDIAERELQRYLPLMGGA